MQDIGVGTVFLVGHDRASARSHDRQGPRRDLDSPRIPVREPMHHRHLRLTWREGDPHLLAQAVGSLLRSEGQGRPVPFVSDRDVVRGIGSGHDLRSVPEAVAAITVPLVAPDLAQRLIEGLEQVVTADEAQPDDPRPHVRGRDQLHPLVTEPDAIRPAAKLDGFHPGRHRSKTIATLPLAPPSIIA